MDQRPRSELGVPIGHHAIVGATSSQSRTTSTGKSTLPPRKSFHCRNRNLSRRHIRSLFQGYAELIESDRRLGDMKNRRRKWSAAGGIPELNIISTIVLFRIFLFRSTVAESRSVMDGRRVFEDKPTDVATL
jgi:hypothetical protein